MTSANALRTVLYCTVRETDADAEGKTLALAVVDGDDEAMLLCMRDAESR